MSAWSCPHDFGAEKRNEGCCSGTAGSYHLARVALVKRALRMLGDVALATDCVLALITARVQPAGLCY